MRKRERHLQHAKVCQHCGKLFYSHYSLAKYCPPKCRQAAYRARERKMKALISELDRVQTMP